ncbi:MAG: ABC transporter permease [Streptosporangiaceae bacterium]|jgi:peptide/nickel transport system permease protein
MLDISAPARAPLAIPRGRALLAWLRANPLITVGALVAALIVCVALFAPLLAPYPADAGSATHPFQVLKAPSAQHWFGTDQVGRDILSRVIYGARVSPLVAVFVLLIACAIGIPLGLAAGYFGGWLDEAIMRVTDIFLAFFTTDWWVVTFPGLAILLTAFAFNLLGDGLRDALDPKRGLRL